MFEFNVLEIVLIFLYVVIPAMLVFVITKKMGLSRWYSLLMFLPVVNVMMIWFAATARWCVSNKKSRL